VCAISYHDIPSSSYPAAGAVAWTIYRQQDRASFLELPVKRR
jgi:hypothetical protein